ncbi:4396_t:CDS:2, partial [Cetraspora pellucida]
ENEKRFKIASRLGFLGKCGHLCLIPLNNVVWENNIDDAAIYDYKNQRTSKEGTIEKIQRVRGNY